MEIKGKVVTDQNNNMKQVWLNLEIRSKHF